MSVNLTFINSTDSPVTFGLWSAPHNHSTVQPVDGPGKATNHTDSADARVIGVWTDSNNLYPSNDNPFTSGIYLQEGQSYAVELTIKGLIITTG
jgi:hypothetical protein